MPHATTGALSASAFTIPTWIEPIRIEQVRPVEVLHALIYASDGSVRCTVCHKIIAEADNVNARIVGIDYLAQFHLCNPRDLERIQSELD